MRISPPLVVALLALTSAHCKTGEPIPASMTATNVGSPGLGCDHDVKSNAIARHSWPYPADHRDLRWVAPKKKMQLKHKPAHAAFVTATVTWDEGDLIRVDDSQVRIIKPRRLVAKRDLVVRRKVWDQGIQVERDSLVATEGEVASFLFYNSRGLCMVGTDEGPAWTPCTLDDTFEGLSEENPHPCEQQWWVEVQRRKLDKGWMLVDLALMDRAPPDRGPAK